MKSRPGLVERKVGKTGGQKIDWGLPSMKPTASLHLKIDGWKTIVSFLGRPSGRFYVSCRECIMLLFAKWLEPKLV